MPRENLMIMEMVSEKYKMDLGELDDYLKYSEAHWRDWQHRKERTAEEKEKAKKALLAITRYDIVKREILDRQTKAKKEKELEAASKMKIPEYTDWTKKKGLVSLAKYDPSPRRVPKHYGASPDKSAVRDIEEVVEKKVKEHVETLPIIGMKPYAL